MSTEKSLELERKRNKRKEEYKYFVGTTEKNPLEYTVGERIVFKIRARFMDGYLPVPKISYCLTVENGEDKEGYLECSADGWFYVEGMLNKPGFLYLTARACDENGQYIADIAPFNGGAGADVALIERGTKLPLDYSEFWKSMQGLVDKEKSEVLFSERISDPRYPDFEIYNMRIRAPLSEYASVTVTYPKGAGRKELKLAMLFQGYGVGPAAPYPMPGHLTLHVCAHAMPHGENTEYYETIKKGALKDYGFDSDENSKPETTYWAGMLLRDMAVLKMFENHELVNGVDYCFIGSSQGGMQACNMAAHYEKASALVLNVPWLSDIDGHEECGYRKNTMPKGKGVAYFDTSIAAEGVRCPTCIISGLGDSTCNASTQMALYNALKVRKHIEFYQNKTHSLTLPWDNEISTLGDRELAEELSGYLEKYRDWN